MSDEGRSSGLLVVDVGNTNTVFGLVEEGALTLDYRLETRRNRTEDEYFALMAPLFQREGVRLSKVTDAIISCVVPPALYPMRRLCKRLTGKNPIIIDHHIDVGIELRYHRPEEMGADRLVNAAYSHLRFGGSIVVDFGTATTFDVITPEGVYLGGCITPGVKVSMDALFSRASRLPRIEVARPDNAIGRSTEDAMRSGVYYGYVAMTDGLVARLSGEIPFKPTVIATGGLASLIARDSTTIQVVEKDLALLGLAVLHERLSGKGNVAP